MDDMQRINREEADRFRDEQRELREDEMNEKGVGNEQ